MPAQGAGPSRRSHTKSRKGCKTCKRRHIRCDETFPQCRNCSKHQVRCDYMESVGSDTESQHSPEQQALSFSPGTESRIEQWQNTGSFPYPELSVFPPPPIQEYSRNELSLINHLSCISSDLQQRGTSGLTLWTTKMPKFLSIAASYPYVMHALLSFSANNLAWAQSSSEIRNVSIQHGTVALRGLHEALGSFSHANSDAVLAASLLLLWQATDWRSWSSLRAGIQSVLSVVQSSPHESVFAEYINEEDLFVGSYRSHRRTSSLDPLDRDNVLQHSMSALQRLQAALVGSETESFWIEQLLDYLQRLLDCTPAQTPDEQFNHLYILRKWLFWVPTALLQRPNGQGPAMLTIAHFYAVALALEPLFPDLGSSFCARVALAPLVSILRVTGAMQSQQGMEQTSIEIASLMHFPQQTAMHFRARALPLQPEPSILGVNPETLTYTTIGNLSPAFAPLPLHYTPESTPISNSAYLEVPSQSGFTFGTQAWGAVPSPGFPPPEFVAEAEQVYGGYGDGSDSSRMESFSHTGTPSTPDPAEGGPSRPYHRHY